MGNSKVNKSKVKLPPPNKYASVFYDSSHPAGFTGSATKLHKAVKGSTLASTKQWLSTQDPYTLHKTARKRFAHPRIVVEGLDAQWGSDLLDLQSLAEYNDGAKYVLVAIDTLSKYAWAKPLPNKTSQTVANALKAIFEEGRKPRRLRTDRGREYLGRPVQELLDRNGIVYFSTSNYTKEALSERFIRTIRGKIWRYFRATNTQRYVDELPKLLRSYNESVHSSTGMAPANVTYLNQHRVWNELYGDVLKKRIKWRAAKRKPRRAFDVGDTVRIAKDKRHFEQGYKPNWTEEVFYVTRVDVLPTGEGFKYKVADESGEEILGSFQKQELQKVRRVKREIKAVTKRVKSGKFVTWRGLPSTLTTFVPTG